MEVLGGLVLLIVGSLIGYVVANKKGLLEQAVDKVGQIQKLKAEVVISETELEAFKSKIKEVESQLS